ncbi:MAG: efflux RND transporter permease subunit, partial [Candidatus Obscuribacterales bacterium]|nr:efflux RND transporter permease subunit [Candidatus Obscuribacterales bacterium]
MLIDFVLSKRPLVVFLALILLLGGYHAFTILPLEAYPDVANLQVRVITQVPGKAAEEMERLVTVPLEKELNGIPRAEAPRSISIFGLSVITVVFEDGVDANVARQQVLEKISQVTLPEGVQPQLDPNASPVGEIYRYTVVADPPGASSAMDRKEWQDWVLDRRFKSVKGVVDVTGFGGPVKTYQIELDPDRLKALSLTQSQITNAISSANGSTGGSYIVRNNQDFMVRGLGLLTSVQDIEDIVVATGEGGTAITMKDVADVHVAPALRVGQAGMNEDDDVVEGIVLMRRGENPSTAVASLMDSWNDIAASLPKGMRLAPLYDRTALVRRTVNTIGHNVTEGICLVVVILMLFLFQVRSAIICATVIPLALSAAMILLNVFEVPGNLLSLGAIDFGIIVDGAVVMVENIVRHLSHLKGTPSKELVLATIAKACREVSKPVLFATSIIMCTFLPILTFQSVEGKLFRPLAITMNFNLIGAVLSSLTIIPVLCAVIYANKPPKEVISPVIKLAIAIYTPILKWCMNKKLMTCIIAFGCVFSSMLMLPLLGAEFIPELEEGNIWLRVTILPTSVSLSQAVKIAGEIRKVM